MRFLLLPCYLAISLTAAFPFAAGMQSGSFTGGSSSTPAKHGKATCIPHLFKNAEDKWAIDCSSDTTCCYYEWRDDEGGDGIHIWCDCTQDQKQPYCCHMVLRAFPLDNDKNSYGEGQGVCYERRCGMIVGPCTNQSDKFRVKCEFIG